VTKGLDQLKRDYRKLRAPAYLATRIGAEVAGRGARSRRWIPVTAAATAIAAVVWLVPNLSQRQPPVSPGASTPSFSTLAALRPTTPSVKTPGLSQLRGVTMPALSARPNLQRQPESQPKSQPRTDKPQSRIFIEDAHLEEKNHAHV